MSLDLEQVETVLHTLKTLSTLCPQTSRTKKYVLGLFLGIGGFLKSESLLKLELVDRSYLANAPQTVLIIMSESLRWDPGIQVKAQPPLCQYARLLGVSDLDSSAAS